MTLSEILCMIIPFSKEWYNHAQNFKTSRCIKVGDRNYLPTVIKVWGRVSDIHGYLIPYPNFETFR